PDGHIISLLKPHYELAKLPGPKRPGRQRRPLDEARAEQVADLVCRELQAVDLPVVRRVVSPLKGKGGNVEFLLHIRPGGTGGRARRAGSEPGRV
ncbi:MAG: hypothetical protein ACYS5V_05795, partial [Planctomycetota bacterium]